MGYPTEIHPTWWSKPTMAWQFENHTRENLFYWKPCRYTTRRSTRNSPYRYTIQQEQSSYQLLYNPSSIKLWIPTYSYFGICWRRMLDAKLMGPSPSRSRHIWHHHGHYPSPLKPGRISGFNLYTQPHRAHPITMQLCSCTNTNGPNIPMHIWGNQDNASTNWKAKFEEEQIKKFATWGWSLSLTAILILTPADKIVDLLHQFQASLLLGWELYPLEPQVQ